MQNLRRCYRVISGLAVVCLTSIGLLAARCSHVESVSTDEYAVYSAAMEEAVGGGSYVVLDMTTIHGRLEDLDRTLRFPIEDGKYITADLTADFKNKNRQRHEIAQRFPKAMRVTLISESERSAMFSGCFGEVKCGWKTFYNKYPGAPGFTSLSSVGFNDKHNIALVYVGNVRDWEVGTGVYLLLTNSDGEWKVISKTNGWIA